MKKAISILSLCLACLLCGACASRTADAGVTSANTTKAPATTTPIWEKTEILTEGGWETAQSMEELSAMLTELMDVKVRQGYQRISVTFRMKGYREVSEPFEAAFASVKNKEVNAWNSDRDPYVHTTVILPYRDVDPNVIWNLAQNEEILLVQIWNMPDPTGQEVPE